MYSPSVFLIKNRNLIYFIFFIVIFCSQIFYNLFFDYIYCDGPSATDSNIKLEVFTKKNSTSSSLQTGDITGDIREGSVVLNGSNTGNFHVTQSESKAITELSKTLNAGFATAGALIATGFSLGLAPPAARLALGLVGIASSALAGTISQATSNVEQGHIVIAADPEKIQVEIVKGKSDVFNFVSSISEAADPLNNFLYYLLLMLIVTFCVSILVIVNYTFRSIIEHYFNAWNPKKPWLQKLKIAAKYFFALSTKTFMISGLLLINFNLFICISCLYRVLKTFDVF